MRTFYVEVNAERYSVQADGYVIQIYGDNEFLEFYENRKLVASFKHWDICRDRAYSRMEDLDLPEDYYMDDDE